ncbi:MAG: family sodium-coupled anion symporter [Sphingobacteriaceae bacterium]|jgi:sodium-dependent dicarboxylate transporter 2/3/5|nr:family sodium-coupled anion symporter [Sphingobacteriaceae bacterium]
MNLVSRRTLSFALAGILFFVALLFNPLGLSPNGAKVLSVAVLMITLWVTEALSMPVVALFPLVLFPLLGICKLDEAAAPYANPIIFLFMGGFLIGLAIEKWNLHKRIALNIVQFTGTSGNGIILGFILATGFLSMWLSNTATTMMMYPIAMSVITVIEANHKSEGNFKHLAICLLLSIAYASNFGGIATIIGTPPNVAFVAFLEKKYHYTFQFSDWLMLCMPLSLLLMFVLYWCMTMWLYPNKIKKDAATADLIRNELQGLGRLSAPEKGVLFVFVLTAFLWITKDILNKQETLIKLDDSMIAMAGAILLFIIPSRQAEDKSAQLLEWPDTRNMAWGILLLFGGGISLANQLEKAGLIQLMGNFIAQYAGSNLFLLIFAVSLVSIFISEVMSNVAQVIVFAPVAAGMADALHINPILLGIPMALGASCAGMLPMGTPPNAIVFASGRLRLNDMVKTGFVMNIISTILITLFSYYLIPILVEAIN